MYRTTKKTCRMTAVGSSPLRSQVFHDESGSIWTNLRRGLNDLKRLDSGSTVPGSCFLYQAVGGEGFFNQKMLKNL